VAMTIRVERSAYRHHQRHSDRRQTVREPAHWRERPSNQQATTAPSVT
jgi:hypothetical protein